MDNTKEKTSIDHQNDLIDTRRIFKMLWSRLWLIILAGIVSAAIAMTYTVFMITPKYSASIMLYVNNKSVSVGGTSIKLESSDLVVARNLIQTYITILKNRTTLTQLIEETGIDYTYYELMGMISAYAIDETEVFRITVTATDPYDAAEIANGIGDVLPLRVSEIVDGSSVRIVDKAVVSHNKISPNVTKNTTFGFVFGAFAVAAILIVVSIIDDTIHDEDDIILLYDIPILSKIPELLNDSSAKSSYYKNSYYKI